MSNSDWTLDALLKIAEESTAGRRRVDGPVHGMPHEVDIAGVCFDDIPVMVALCNPSNDPRFEAKTWRQGCADAAQIAAFNREVCIALIDAAKVLKRIMLLDGAQGSILKPHREDAEIALAALEDAGVEL